MRARDRLAGTAGGDGPLGAVALGHDLVPVESVLHNVLGIETEINRLLVPADGQISQGKFGDRFDEPSLAVPMLEGQGRFELSKRIARRGRDAQGSVRACGGGPVFEGFQVECRVAAVSAS